MFTAYRYPLLQSVRWSITGLIGSALWSALVVAAYDLGGLGWLPIPAMPVTVLGTAVSFYLGFKGNAAYQRLWEARKIWGGIVNTSRTWGIHVTAFVGGGQGAPAMADTHRRLVYRHIAWLAALRFRLLRPKSWEHRQDWNDAYREGYGTLDTSDEAIGRAMHGLVDPDELSRVNSMKNQATQLLHNQGQQLARLHRDGHIDDFRHMELAGLLETMFTLQGKCERIKNFPLPRQYSSANDYFVKLFTLMLPFAMIGQFEDHRVWLAVPITALLGWVFHLWNLVVDYSENPFEGLINDIPMAALSRTIEIDLREILGETELPPALAAHDHVLM